MRKPFETGAKPTTQPNEPKMYPGDQGFKQQLGGTNLDGFAENAKVKGADQFDTVKNPIEAVHIYGSPAAPGEKMHTDTKMASSLKMPSFADQEKVNVPRERVTSKLPKV